MVKGRLPRESNPLPGDKSGFVASHDTTGDEDYERTSPLNPLPVTSIGDSNVKDAAVKAELELIRQGIEDNKATNDLILARLDNPIDTQLTGSNVVQDVNVLGDYVTSEQIVSVFEIAGGAEVYVPELIGIDTNCTQFSLSILSRTGNHTLSANASAYFNGGMVMPRVPLMEEEATMNQRIISKKISPLTPSTGIRIRNHDVIAHEYSVTINRFFNSKGYNEE